MGKASEQYPRGWRLAVIILSLFLGTFLVAIDTTIVSVAIPEISTQFHALNDVGWYGSAYLITMTALQPAGGIVYKLFNVKAVYMISFLIFEGMVLTLNPLIVAHVNVLMLFRHQYCPWSTVGSSCPWQVF